jgi:hypothetical protein
MKIAALQTTSPTSHQKNAKMRLAATDAGSSDGIMIVMSSGQWQGDKICCKVMLPPSALPQSPNSHSMTFSSTSPRVERLSDMGPAIGD